MCPIGQSVFLGPNELKTIQLPYRCSNASVYLCSTGNAPRGLFIFPTLKPFGKPLKITMKNMTIEPIQIGSRSALVAFMIGNQVDVAFERVNGREMKLNRKIRGTKDVYEVESQTRSQSTISFDLDSLESWKKRFPAVFSQELGCVNHYRVNKLNLKKDLKFHKLKVQATSKAEESVLRPLIEEMLDAKVIEQVDSAPKVLTPLMMVPKASGGWRVVADFRCLNSLCEPIQSLPLDRNKLLCSLPKKKYWTSIDLKQGYQQLELSSSIRTWFGFSFAGRFYQYRRVPFGWLSSGAHFQLALATTLSKVRDRLPVDCFLGDYVDDIIIGTDTKEMHKLALNILFEELASHNWSVNEKKVSLAKSSVEFLGAHLTESGIRPTSGLLRKINELMKPRTSQELRQFYGLLLQLNRYTFRQDKITSELDKWKRKKPIEFQSIEFDEVWKRAIGESTRDLISLEYYDENQPLTVHVDASSTGYGGVLLSGGKPMLLFSKKNPRPHEHSSVSELNAILDVLEAFRFITIGKQVTVFTDNWSSLKMCRFENQSDVIKRRLDHLLDNYPHMKFVAGKENDLADLLSRFEYLHPRESPQVCAITSHLNEDDKRFVRDLHLKGHYGLPAMKALLKKAGRYSPEMSKEAEWVVKSCPYCQKWRKKQPQESFSFIEAKKVSDAVGIDFAGPLKSTRDSPSKFLIVMTDYYSRVVRVKTVTKITTRNTLKEIQNWCEEHGVMSKLVSDSGPQFRAKEIRDWCRRKHVRQILSAPYHPESNGLIERTIQSILSKIRRLMLSEGRSWHSVVKSAVDAHNNGPHSSLGSTPYEVRYGIDPFGNRLSRRKWRSVS